MQFHSEDGYALPSVLLISLLVTTLLLAMLSIIYVCNRGNSKLQEKKQLELACYSAIQSTLEEYTELSSDTSTVFLGSTEVELTTKQNGFYWEVTASAKGTNDSTKIRYILGIKANDRGYFSNAVVLSRQNLRATVAGNTTIKGNILGTSNRIVLGNIFGQPPTNKNYLNGELKIDSSIKAQLMSDSLFYQAVQMFENIPSIINEDEKEITSQMINGFDEDAVYVFTSDIKIIGDIGSKKYNPIKIKANGKIDFADHTINKAKFEIYSDSTITIGKNCHIENTLIFATAPIIIEDGSYFKNVQFFSTDSIHIKDCQFDFPSLLCLNLDDTDSAKQDNGLIVENSTVNGSVLLMTKTSGLSSNKAKIKIDDKSRVQGLVYCENNLELHGKVTGTAYTYNFWYYKEPTEYINWLINVDVDRKSINEWFLYPAVFSDQGKYEILKEEWIY